jgi:CheY-like chemotaxis protein
MVSVIRESGTTLLALLNDVLDLSKIEAGRMELERTGYSVADIVRSAEAIFTTRAHQKGISLAVALEPDADIWCLGDPTRVRQVLYNLLSNAVKFTQSGGVRVVVRALPAAEGGAGNSVRIAFAVADTGIGIDPEARDRLFQRFTQADARTTRRYGGTGLGLAISRDLARLMGGDISYAPAPDGGSVFTFHLDCQRAEPPARTDAHAFGESLEATGETSADLHVLAAEDNAHNRLVLQLMLEQVGVVPVFAENGRVALDLWQARAFDVILMDVQMPEMSGLEATRRIREIEAASGRARTPVIALTANAMTHHVQECLQAGMDAHVAKPIRPELLFAAIDAAL